MRPAEGRPVSEALRQTRPARLAPESPGSPTPVYVVPRRPPPRTPPHGPTRTGPDLGATVREGTTGVGLPVTERRPPSRTEALAVVLSGPGRCISPPKRVTQCEAPTPTPGSRSAFPRSRRGRPTSVTPARPSRPPLVSVGFRTLPDEPRSPRQVGLGTRRPLRHVGRRRSIPGSRTGSWRPVTRPGRRKTGGGLVVKDGHGEDPRLWCRGEKVRGQCIY